jgi:peptide/nickel transport system substrate-binding protein
MNHTTNDSFLSRDGESTMDRSLRFRRSSSLIALATVAALAACKENTGTERVVTDANEVAQQGAVALVNDAVGPAAPVPGAKPGGTITMLFVADFEHLDPAQNYINNQQVASQLFQRTLTMFREHEDGTFELVGDLATNTGVSPDGGKTWTFTLRDGIKYEDGRPITSKDVAYGIARSFSPDLPHGAHYIQQWLADDLDYNKVYKGPYNGGSDLPPGVETPDDKTIVFHFKTARPDMPFASALAMASPVPKDKDTKQGYDNHPVASGPYKIGQYNRGQKLILVKNEHWDPATDPARHQYPDTIAFDFGQSNIQINERIIASDGADATALTWMITPQEVLPKVLADSAVMKRVVRGFTQYTRYLAINMQRVPDLKVRQALNYAIDRDNFMKVYSPVAAEPSSTIESPTTLGFQKYDAYPGGPNGDLAKAKELLGGKTVPLVYAYVNTPRWQKVAVFVQENLKKAGFDVTIQPVDPDLWYTNVGRKDNPFDIYIWGWGFDWPSGVTIIPPLFDGRTIAPSGNQNASFLNAPEVNAKIDSISAIADLAQAGAEWAKLDRYIMETYAPIVPLTYEKNFTLNGTRVGGAYLSPAYGVTAMNSLYVR